MRFAERFGSLSPLKKIGGCGFVLTPPSEARELTLLKYAG